ncbi:MAG: hypothetical protein J5755_01920, partial [Clostridia bacterium]|nr:hypothetical protein [Clostridia bacterium]
MARTRTILVSGLLVFLLALGSMLALSLGLNQVETAEAAGLTSPSNICYFDPYNGGAESSFYEAMPQGYSFNGSTSTLTISEGARPLFIWTTRAGDLTVVFETDYGYQNSRRYGLFEVPDGSLTLTSSSSVDVYLDCVRCTGDLTVSGGVNLNVCGLIGSTDSSYDVGNLIYAGSKLQVSDDASIIAKDPYLYAKSRQINNACIAKCETLYLDTTGSFKVGLYDTTLGSERAAALSLGGSVDL